jgi:acyl-CoA synthetase (NDP forming)
MSEADTAAAIVGRAVAAGHDTMLEPEGYALLAALGLRTPHGVYVADAREAIAADLSHLGDSVVVKVACRAISHKSDLGGVAVVRNDSSSVRAAIETMARRLAGIPLDGFLISELVPHSLAFGGELLVALRQTDDFGPVVVIGPGGVHAELLAQSLRTGQDLAVFASWDTTRGIRDRVSALPVSRVAAGLGRDRSGLVDVETLTELIELVLQFGRSDAGATVAELEMNPVAFVEGTPVALDVLVRLRPAPPPPAPPRPLRKLARLLRPRSAAVVGVSDGMNAGRIILRNMLREGFPRDRLAVVKPATDRIDGVPCFATLADLPGPVDLCVLAVGASQIPELIDEIVAGRRAESVIVIPGGLGERSGSGTLEARIRERLTASRATPWEGPVVNGGNCLGIRSVPGRYDTTFIPEYKLGLRADAVAPVALIAQSGAFAVARWSKLAGATPRYLVSIGNQTDLTVGDYLTDLRDDPDVRVFACFVEGFRAGDGVRWLVAAEEIVRSGRIVVLYRGARTAEGRKAGISHTAAIAGDYAVTRELAERAGVLVADTLDEFDDLLRSTCLLVNRPVRGGRVGAVTNAGFECVAIGDGLRGLRLASLSSVTEARLRDVLARYHLEQVVDVQHPLDVTPMMDAAGISEVVGILLDDDAVDVGLVGVVPLTGALETLPASPSHRERLDSPNGIVAHLAGLREAHATPFVTVVDAGPAYDPLAARLEEAGILTFRTVDRALRTLARLVDHAVASAPAQPPAMAGAGT